jgi:predicted ATPase
VRLFEIDDLSSFVVIAGQNGCGKSCLFDAIRLLKSFYGGYSQDEYMQWFSELAINVQDRRELRRVFRDPSQPIEITAVIDFSDAEKQFMLENRADLVWPIAWQRATGQRIDHWSFNQMAIATQLAQHQQEVDAEVAALSTQLKEALAAPDQTISLTITPDGSIDQAECLPAHVSFQADRPDNLGIIEYHSASRTYTRQPLQGINLDARAFQDQRRQQRLYNWQAKYQNVKTELATGYLRNLIAAQSGEVATGEDLNETLKELFKTFFPEKVYEGVRPLPQGSLEFPVRLPGGERHDIDDLSSGEKEILYGYLRLRNSIPRGSVILLDEPELHLNPSLLQGFPDFYYRHLGVAQGNQLWLVTHSDTLLRQAIGNSNYRVYHMISATSSTGNQASPVLLDDDVDRAVVDLVGDLAAYRPHAKVVILEGKDEDSFDIAFVQRLFPEFGKRVNLVSVGSKRRVRDLYDVLETSTNKAGDNRFFAIVDRDAESYGPTENAARVFKWDVYHIENYLLEPTVIRESSAALAGKQLFSTDAEVLAALAACAEKLITKLVLERIQAEVNAEIVDAISIGGPSDAENVAEALRPSVEGSVARVVKKGDELTASVLEARVEQLRGELENAVKTGAWKVDFPGRLILKRFVSDHLSGINYTSFRNLIVDKMVALDKRPGGMQKVLDQIEPTKLTARAVQSGKKATSK